MKNTAIMLSIFVLGSHIEASVLELRNAIVDLEAYCNTSRYSRLSSVEQFGISSHDLDTAPVVGAITAVSNNWQDALADWDYYATNGTARMLLKNLISYSGTNAYIGIWSGLLDLNALDNARCPPQVVEDFAFPGYYPLYQYAQLHYQNPAVSNCVYRTSLLFPNLAAFYASILNGSLKELIEDEMAVEALDNE